MESRLSMKWMACGVIIIGLACGPAVALTPPYAPSTPSSSLNSMTMMVIEAPATNPAHVGKPPLPSSLKTLVSNTRTVGASGSYLDSMGSEASVHPISASVVTFAPDDAPATPATMAAFANAAAVAIAAPTAGGGSYFDNFGGSSGAGKPPLPSTLKAAVSNTRTVGASGSYFDSMGSGASVHPVSAPVVNSAPAAPAPVAATVTDPTAAAAAPTAGGGSYFDNFGSSSAAGKPPLPSNLKAPVSNTRTVGASGSYFDSMGSGASVHPVSAPVVTSAPTAPVPVSAAATAPAAATTAAPTAGGGSYFDKFGGSSAAGKPPLQSNLKTPVSNTRTVGASGTYFDSIGGSVFSTAPSTDDSIRLAPLAVPAVPATAAAKISNGKEAPAPPREVVYEEISFVWDTRALKRGLAALAAAGLGCQFLRAAFDVVAEQFAQGPPF